MNKSVALIYDIDSD